MTLTEAFEAYKSDVIVFRNQSSKTEEHHQVTLKSLRSFSGDIDIVDLTFSIVRDWKISLEKRHLSQLTIRGYLVRLRVVLAYLRLKGYKTLDPELIKLPSRIQRVPEVISATDVQLLIDSTDKIRNKTIISLLYSTGLRVSELCSLNREDVKEDYFTILGKGGKSRLCFIDQRTRALLNIYLTHRSEGYDVRIKTKGRNNNRVRYHAPGDNHEALFLSPQIMTRITPGTIQEILKNTRKKAGFKTTVHPHTLRHSFATNLMKNGCGIYALSQLMGHASIQTTAIYLHLVDKDLEETHQKYHTV